LFQLFGDNELGYLELSKLQESNAQGLNGKIFSLRTGNDDKLPQLNTISY